MEEYPLLYGLWDLEKFRNFPFYINFETCKNSEPSNLIQALGLGNILSFPSLFKLRNLEKFWAFPQYSVGSLDNLWDLGKFRAFPPCMSSGFGFAN